MGKGADSIRRRLTPMHLRIMVVCVGTLAASGLLAILIVTILSRLQILSQVSRAYALPGLTFLISIVSGIIISFFLVAWSMRPVREFTEATHRVIEGDYTVRVEIVERDGDLADLQNSFNQMVEELQSTEVFRNDFINDFSHEFKTPIVSIHGFAGELLKGDISEKQRREYCQIIYDESQRLADLSSSVLLLSKLESQQLISEREREDLAEMIRRSILSLQTQWEEKELVIEPNLCEVEILCNLDLLVQVWLNLLDNAIKFSPVGGKIEITSSLQGDTVEVSFADEGPGMDEETAQRVFEKFFQGDASHTARGNGIGLPLVKRVVELHGGTVELDTAPGAGSIFTVILPVG